MKPSYLPLLLLPLIAGCSGGGVRDTLGLNHQAPDEFRVVSRPPLSVPPEFNLRPPGSSQGSAAPTPTDQQAEALVLGSNSRIVNSDPIPGPIPNADTAVIPVTAHPFATGADAQFLQNAGAQQANPKVRTLLQQDREVQVQANDPDESHWYNVFSDAPKKDSIVNAKAEATRIQDDKAQGKPVTTGDTPVVPNKDTGVLGRIFNY